jgi:hypothetical protein
VIWRILSDCVSPAARATREVNVDYVDLVDCVAIAVEVTRPFIGPAL